MPSDEEFAALEGRITELENQLSAHRERARVTREEYETYVKVHNVLVGRFPLVNINFCGGVGGGGSPCRAGDMSELNLGRAPDANPVDEGGADRFDGLGG